ncbi:MAG: hypothetical protein RL141_819 [Candidatus Parcubacteria bacterium]|jgi:drug/metabolite transporter (DMT)-like permease
MFSWFFFAIVGHVANGAAFVIDKTLLRGSFKRPATYAALIGTLSIVVLILIPFGVAIPDARGWILMAASGATFVFALWAFFAALANGEASRVVPVVGSLIPLITLAGTATFLGETLTATQGAGFFLLLVATVILSGGKRTERLQMKTIGVAILAAVLFAFSSVTAKAMYDGYGFLSGFTLSRLFSVGAGVLLLVIDRRAYRELLAGFFKKQPAKKGDVKNAIGWVVGAQVLGGIGFLGVQYATSLGSAALVNALQAVQYAFLVLVAFVLSKRAPLLLGESVRLPVVLQKGVAILLVAIGLWLVV